MKLEGIPMISDFPKLTAAIDAVTDPPLRVNFAAFESRLNSLSSADISKLRETIESGSPAELNLGGHVLSIKVRGSNGQPR